MSLGYPSQTPLQYNPFLKTSFGFGANALQNLPNNPFPNATDYVRVVITVDDATHWDDSGHIQTEEVGTAVSIYSSETFTWEVDGERDDVEAILAELVFYPPAYQPLTDWRPTEMKENVTDGNFTDEQPEDTAAVPNTQMEITVYSSTNWVTAYDIYVEAVNPYYDNTRPYFSSSAQVIDVADSAFDNTQGELLPLELVVENTDDEEYLEVKAEFLRVSDGTQITENSFGFFTDYQDLYLGGKKGLPQNTTDKRFNFVGRKAECNTFLENLEFTTNPQIPFTLPADSSFFIRTSVSDGQIGSYIDTLIWHSDTTISWYGDLQTQSFIEDTTAFWDLGEIVFQNLDSMGEVDVYSTKVKLTFGGSSEVGYDDFYTSTTVDSQTISVDTSSGNAVAILTITDTNPNTVLTALRNLVFRPKRDFHSNFSLGLGFEFNSTVYGTTYSTSGYSTIVVNGANTPELSNRYLTFNTDEGVPFNINSGLYPQIVHPINDRFKLTLTFSNQNGGNLWSHNGGDNFLTKINSGVWEIEGSKNEVNFCLQNLYIYHDTYTADNDLSYTVNLTLDRLHPVDDQYWDPLETGTWTVNVTPTTEAEMATTEINYREDNTLYFNFGYDITDTASLYAQNNTLYNSQYRVEIRSFLMDGSGFIDIGSFTSLNTGSLIGYGGTTKNGGALYLQGYPSDIETALANMKFLPDVDEYDDFKVRLDLYRLADNKLLEMSQRTFRGTQVDEYQNTSTSFDWTEDTSLYFDSLIRITDEADENPDYTQYQSEYKVNFRIKDSNNNIYDAYNFFSLTLDSITSYDVNKSLGTFEMIGSKSAINANLANFRFVPQPQVTEGFISEFRIERLSDNVVFVDYNDTLTFNTGTDTTEFSHLNGVIQFEEDTYVHFDSQLRIADRMPDNQDYSDDIRNSTYTVEVRLVYNDTNMVSQPFTDAFLTLDNTAVSNLSSLVYSGNGQFSSPLTLTANKWDMNNALQNAFVVFGNGDVRGAPSNNGEFFIEFNVTRNYDSSQSQLPTFNSGVAKTMFRESPDQIEVEVFPTTLQVRKNTWIEFNTGVEITDTADEIQANFYQADYKVEVRNFSLGYWEVVGDSPNTAGKEIHMWVPSTNGVIGRGTDSLTIQGSKSFCNQMLSNFRVASAPDTIDKSANGPYSYLQFRVTRIKDDLEALLFDWHDTNQVRLLDYDEQFILEQSQPYTEETIIENNGTLDVDIRETILMPYYYYTAARTHYQVEQMIVGDTPQWNGADVDAPYLSFTNSDYRLTIKYPNDNGNRTVEKIVSSSPHIVTNELQENNDWLLVIEATKFEIDQTLNQIDLYPYRDYNSNIIMEKTLVRIHDNYESFNNTSTFFDGTNADTPEYDPFWESILGDIFTDEDNEDLFVIEPGNPYRIQVRDIILDGAENVTDNVTYQIIIETSPLDPTDHEVYLEEPYFASDYISFEDYVLNTKVVFEGTKEQCNYWLAWDFTFSTLQHITEPTEYTEILYTQKRLVDGVDDVIHADRVRVAQINVFQDTNVVDSTTISPGPQHYWYNFDDTWEWSDGGPYAVTPPTLDVKVSHDWNRLYPTLSNSIAYYGKVLDNYTENGNPSQYKAVFSSTDTLTYYALDTIYAMYGDWEFDRKLMPLTNGSTAWMSKAELNKLLKDVAVYGASDNKTVVNTTIYRKTHSGLEEQLYSWDMPHWTMGRPQLDFNGYTTPISFDLGVDETFQFHAVNYKLPTFQSYDVTSVSEDGSQTVLFPFSDKTISPSPPSGIDITSNGNTIGGITLENTLTEPFKYDFEYKPNNRNIQQTYKMSYVGHSFDPLTTIADLNNETELVFDHLVPKPNYQVQDIYHHAEILQCEALNNQDLVIDIQGIGVTSFTQNPSDNVRLKITCKAYDDITQSGYILQDSVSDSSALEITSSSNDLRVGDLRVSDIVKKPDGVYFTAWITTNPYETFVSRHKIGIFKVSYDENGYLILTKIKEFEDYASSSSSIENSKIMANLSHDIDIMTIITSPINNTQTLKVYYKDLGGTDNWGLQSSQALSTVDDFVEFTNGANWDQLISTDYTIHSNVCHSFFNGTDTIVTMSGRVYKKDQGGLDNWGYVKTIILPSIDKQQYRCGFTKDYFFLVNFNESSNNWEISIYDENIDLIALVYKDSSFVFEGSSGVTEPNGLSFVIANIGDRIIQHIYFSKTSNTIFFTEAAYLESYGTNNGWGTINHSIKLQPK